ncbi:MAG: SAM-dependent methyltransferase [Lachnospiraceae bacterium]|nr:SAM-dependent methyltransferase [Lachnospiraceae bacterium]
MIKLSKRLEALGRLCEVGSVAADVGCDHGYLSIRLVQEGIFERMLAMDLREGPLAAAKAHVAEAGLADRIECRLSDGLRAMQIGEADSMICAGMGGPLMQRILEQDIDKVRGMRQLVLQPQSDMAQFRRWLRENGFVIIAEDIVFEDGKYYPMMKAVPENEGMTDSNDHGGCEDAVHRETVADFRVTVADPELSDAFGPYLLAQRHPVLLEYLKQRNGFVSEALKQLEQAQRSGSDERRAQRVTELQQEKELIKKAMAF